MNFRETMQQLRPMGTAQNRKDPIPYIQRAKARKKISPKRSKTTKT